LRLEKNLLSALLHCRRLVASQTSYSASHPQSQMGNIRQRTLTLSTAINLLRTTSLGFHHGRDFSFSRKKSLLSNFCYSYLFNFICSFTVIIFSVRSILIFKFSYGGDIWLSFRKIVPIYKSCHSFLSVLHSSYISLGFFCWP